MATIKAGRKLGLLKGASTDRLIVDTTVTPKAVAHPTDLRLLEKSRQHLVKLAEDNGIALRQNYNREASRITMQIGQYAHAKQFRHMKRSLRTLKSRVGRVYRDVGRQIEQIAEMTTDGRLGRNPLEGALGDALHAVLCGAGHNIRLLLKKLRLLITFIVWAIGGDRAMNHGAQQLAIS